MSLPKERLDHVRALPGIWEWGHVLLKANRKSINEKKKINKKIINVLLGFWLSSHLIPGKGTAWAGCSRCPRALRVFPTAASLPPEAGESTWAVRNTSQSVQMRMSNVRRLVTRCERSHSTDTWGEEQNLQPAATFLGTYCCL